MEFVDGGCLTDLIDFWPQLALDESEIAYVCREVTALKHRINFFMV